MKWTKEKPTQPGMYWYRKPSPYKKKGKGYAAVCEVMRMDIENPDAAFLPDTEWSSGPISEPKDPTP